jgi:hypothetical protein
VHRLVYLIPALLISLIFIHCYCIHLNWQGPEYQKRIEARAARFAAGAQAAAALAKAAPAAAPVATPAPAPVAAPAPVIQVCVIVV